MHVARRREDEEGRQEEGSEGNEGNLKSGGRKKG